MKPMYCENNHINYVTSISLPVPNLPQIKAPNKIIFF